MTKILFPSLIECSATKRIILALKKYHSFRSKEASHSHHDHRNLVHFCKEIYPSLLDDYIHVIHTHHDELDVISDIMEDTYGIESCDVNDCNFFCRRYRDQSQGSDDNESNMETYDKDYVFYKNIMDTIHCYIFHSFDTAMRLNIHKEINEEYENKADGFDVTFSNICKSIQQRTREISLKSKRFSNNKFSINVNRFDGNSKNSTTFIDGLYRNVKFQGISDAVIGELQEYIVLEEFDTDSLLSDLASTESNITRRIVTITCQSEEDLCIIEYKQYAPICV